MSKNIKAIFVALSFIVFALLIKLFYFDTNMGFNTEIVELNYSAFPMFVDVAITVIVTPFLVYGILESIYDKIYSFIKNN